jgi:hypothetical protein
MLGTRNVEKNEFVVSCDLKSCKKELVLRDHSEAAYGEYLPPGWYFMKVQYSPFRRTDFYACCVAHAVHQMPA